MISPTEPKVNEDIALSVEKENERRYATNIWKDSSEDKVFTYSYNYPEKKQLNVRKPMVDNAIGVTRSRWEEDLIA